jgi:hypothetical protein
MKHERRVAGVLLRSWFWSSMRRALGRHGMWGPACFIYAFLWCTAVVLAQAESPQYTVHQISEALAAHAAQCADIHFGYGREYAIHDATGATWKIYKVFATYDGSATGTRERLEYRIYTATGRDRLDAVPAPSGGQQPFLELTSADILISNHLICFDGESTLDLNYITESGHAMAFVYPGRYDRAFWEVQTTPADFVWGFARLLPYSKLLLPRYGTFVVEHSDELLDSLHTVKLTGSGFGGRLNFNLWVCPSRGFLPIRMEMTDTWQAENSGITDLSSLIEVKPGIWFPQLIVVNMPGRPKGESPEFTVMRSVSLVPLPDSTFHPSLPLGTAVTDTVKGVSFVVSGTAPTTQETEKELQDFIDAAARQGK